MNSVVNSGKITGDDSTDGDIDKSEDTVAGANVVNGDNEATDTWNESGQDSDRVQVVEGKSLLFSSGNFRSTFFCVSGAQVHEFTSFSGATLLFSFCKRQAIGHVAENVGQLC